MKIEKTAIKTKLKNAKADDPISFSHSPQAIRETICLKAYELYCARNGAHGNDLEDWLKAERLVLKDILQMITDDKKGIAANR